MISASPTKFMQIASRNFDFTRPVIMGILNVTPDSFSDGGEFIDPNKAVAKALQMAEDGADIIDIGGESSRPGSKPVSAEEELRRVIPVIEAIRSGCPTLVGEIAISIDTTKSVVAAEAIEAGANMINDISAGTFDSEMFTVAARADVPICIMHMRGNPKTMQSGDIHYDDVVGEICEYLEERISAAVKAGIKRENIIIDPGIGFGKTVEHNVTILKELKRFQALECPVLIGTSRKSFIDHLLANGCPTLVGSSNAKERLEGTLATIGIAVQNGANIVRVHDVAETCRFWTILATFLDYSR